MKHFIYADNAATTKLDKDAFNAMLHGFKKNMAMRRNHIHLHVNRKKP